MRKFLILLAIQSFGMFPSPAAKDEATQTAIYNWFVDGVADIAMQIGHMQMLVNTNDTAQWRPSFIKLRQRYKRMSLLSDRLFPFETLQWNAPAITRVEDDNPQVLIAPQGMQQLEVLLFDQPVKNADKEKIADQLQLLAELSLQIKENATPVMFSRGNIWQSLRDGWISIVTKGITGFDSPLAGLSLPETEWQLEGMDEVLVLLQTTAAGEEDKVLQQTIACCKKAIIALDFANDFDTFNRLLFIRNEMVPLAQSLEQLALLPDYALPKERHPLQNGRVNIFADLPFDISFFAPNERYLPNAKRVMLGQKLFSDKRLSGNNKQSCAGCHVPEKGFTDGRKKALALDGKTPLLRNTPTLWNAGLQARQFYDMRQSLLDFQVGNVVHSTEEMGGTMQQAVGKLLADENAVAAFKEAYASEPQPLAVHTLSNAIASYLRMLVAYRSPTDDFINGDTKTIDPEIAQGFNLFTGKAGCATCHFLPAYNGLVPPRYQETEAEVLGVPATTATNSLDDDLGRFYFTNASIHKHAFKTPGLRNVALTAPYMHNGVFNTLEEVIDFYNDGGGAGRGISVPNQTLPTDKLNLSVGEKKALIAFMQSLTDTAVLHVLH